MPQTSTTPPPPPRLRTNVSRTYWCDPGDHYLFKPASIAFLDDEKQTCWLDHLLDGGLVSPGGWGADHKRALTLLLSGSPGSGKSTLALEICTRWSKKANDNDNPNEPLKERGWNTLYITTEAHGPWLVAKAANAGWPSGKVDLYSSKHALTSSQAPADGTVHVWPIMDDAEIVAKMKKLSARGKAINSLQLLINRIAAIHHPKARPYDVLVFDSANTVTDKATRALLFHYFRQLVTSGPKIVLIVADAQSHGADEDFWDFMSDIVIRLTRKVSEERYMVRTIEVVKARYQSHVWGVHQLKPYGSNNIASEKLVEPAAGADRKQYYQKASERMRAHPYRQRAGIFIFPSIHYILSVLKKQAPFTPTESISSAVPGLDPLLKGYPRHRCTALIGCRGGHKSHLAFLETIARLVNGSGKETNTGKKYNDRALIITLRDDEGMTRETLQKILVDKHKNILSQKLNDDHITGLGDDDLKDAADKLLRDWEVQGRLEISYFPPGYITPEEFFHRVLLTLNRLKRRDPKETDQIPHVTVVVNSLDQLSSRFPLCASQAIFVPGIIQVLSSESASSFFVAAEEPEHPGLYGLDTMAELILDFSLQNLPKEAYINAVAERFNVREFEKLNTLYSTDTKYVSAVIVRVARYAGGQAAGARGVLELIPGQSVGETKHPLRAVTADLNLTCVPLPTSLNVQLQ